MEYTTKTQRMKGALQGVFIGSAAAVVDRVFARYGSDNLLVNLGLGTGTGALAGAAFPRATNITSVVLNKVGEVSLKGVKGIAKLSYTIGKAIARRANEKSESRLENLAEEEE